MKVIILGTGDIALEVLRKLQDDVRINVLGVICDASVKYEANEQYQQQIMAAGGKILEFREENLTQADIIFACEYRKAIAKDYVERYLFLNCHAGILPKYRGFSANPSAIMNGESDVGYTIHRMDEKLDNGDICYIGKFTIQRQETYADVHEKIFQDMVARIGDILYGVYRGKIKLQKQETTGVYCSRFNAQMGDLGDFSENAEYMYNLFRCMAKPHGTGVYFYYKGKRYNVGAMIPGNDLQLEDYLGIPGKVVNCADGAIWVKTRDNVVVLSELTDEDGEHIPVEYFKIGNKFGK